MKYARRADVAMPASLNAEGSKAADERSRAMEFYANLTDSHNCRQPSNEFEVNPDAAATDCTHGSETFAGMPRLADSAKRSFSFRAYKGEDVKKALSELFKNKCAYCESEFSSVTSMHVEHYRPKQRIAGEPEHPGYWWLASTWENLLPACPMCNSGEYQEVHRLTDEEEYTQPFNGRAHRLGKLDHFPIKGARAMQASQVSAEVPLLIDPSATDPALHLEWVNEERSLVTARKDSSGAPDERGYTTYRVLGLNRQALVDKRTGIMLRVKKILQRVERDAIRAIQTQDPVARADLLKEIDDGIVDAESFTNSDQPYSMMAKTLVSQTLLRIAETLERAGSFSARSSGCLR